MDNIDTKIQEEWKIVPKHVQFEVSNLGNIRNSGNKRLRIPSNNGNGYRRITIVENKIHKTLYIHRAVLEAFSPLDNSDNLDINHKDFNRGNNIIFNLEWMEHKENMQNSFKNGKFKNRDIKRSIEYRQLGDSGKHQWSKLDKNQIEEVYKLWFDKQFSYKQLGEKFNMTTNGIYKIIQRYKNGRYNQ